VETAPPHSDSKRWARAVCDSDGAGPDVGASIRFGLVAERRKKSGLTRCLLGRQERNAQLGRPGVR
jgi:hypothetical protein